MILKALVGRGFRGLDSYVSSKPGALLLVTNMGGQDPRQRAREIAGLRSARPGLGKAVGHVVLSHDPSLPDLSEEQWRSAIDIARAEHQLGEAPFAAVLHKDADHRHVHLFFLRVRPDGSVVSDSNSYKKNEIAARRIERELGLPEPKPADPKKKFGNREVVEKAARRSRRLKQKGEVEMDTGELSLKIREALGRAKSVDEFERDLTSRKIEVEWSMRGEERVGVKFRPVGSSTWLKGSTVSRDMSAAKLIAAIAARQAEGNSAATPTPEPAVADQPEVQSARPAMDPLDFLDARASQAEPLAPVTLPAQALPQSEDRRRQREQEARDADQEITETLKRASARTLVWLRSLDTRVPREVLDKAALERLLILCLRVLTLGVLKPGAGPAMLEIQARQDLGRRADQELVRRREAASGLELKKEARDQQGAIEHRILTLSARKAARATDFGSRPGLAEAAWDARRAAAGQLTLAAARKAAANAVREVEAVEGAKPRGLDMLKPALAREWRRRLEASREARARAAAAVQALLLELEAAQRAAALQEKREEQARAKAEQGEMDSLKLEIASLEREGARPDRPLNRDQDHHAEAEEGHEEEQEREAARHEQRER